MSLHLPMTASVTSARLRSFGWKKILRAAVAPGCTLLFIGFIGAGIFWRSQALMQDHLREYLRTAAAMAVLQFDGDVIDRLDATKAVRSSSYAGIVEGLNDIRREIPAVRYAYIMERTDDPLVLRFLADADSLSSDEELDVNQNGIVEEDEEPSYPGDLYEIDDVPALQGPAFLQSTVDTVVIEDDWGRLISGYAPIHASDGRVVAVLGLDMQANAFEELSHSIFSFDALLLVLLGGGILALYVAFELRRKRLEAGLQLEADRRALMDLASHQLGAPLTTFKWWLEILKDQDGGKLCKNTDVCNQMDEGIKRMDSIIQALRSANVGDTTQDRASCALPPIIEQALSEASAVLAHKRQTTNVQLEDNLPSLRIDGVLLDGAIEELLENASSYSGEDSVITIRAKRSGSSVLLEVEDTGTGISPEELPHISQKFTRGANAFRQKPVGNGLGLWIVRSIVERAGGKFWVTSQLGKGTTVHLLLPVA